MKSLKKTLVLLVVFSMILSAVMPAFAATDVAGLDCEEEVARLEALKVVSGYDDGTFGPEKTITRAEMAVILCKMVGIDTVTVEENANVPSKFSDVAAGQWYTGHINVAAGKGLLSGFPDGTFRPNDNLTMNQVLTLCVNALGRGEYVAEMGTWPANYIAEATKLGLLDGVKTPDANRGNVAIIAWNTLEAPYVWDVSQTEFEGTINLGNSNRSLLGIYFRDYVYTDEDAKVVDVLKEAKELTVEDVPATNKTLEDRQIVLVDNGDEDGWDEFVKAFSKKSKDDTYFDEDNKQVIATVPTDVWANLDELLGKEVTVLFGEDEVVALIVVTNDTVIDGAFVEEYNADDKEITIAGEDYEFAKDAKVYVNNVEQTSENVAAAKAMENILGILGEEPEEDFQKRVAAVVILDEDDEIERLDLTVSGTYEEFKTIEAIVIEVPEDEEEFEYVYLAQADNSKTVATYDYSKLKTDDLPEVIIDGEKASLEDIKEGNVIVIAYSEAATADDFVAKEVGKIVVTTGLVEGAVTRTKEKGNVVYIDGTAYSSSLVDALAFTDDDIEDILATGVAGKTVEKDDEVKLYVNALNEIVMLATDNAGDGSDWEFAYVRKVDDIDNDIDAEELYAELNLLLLDGTRSKDYKIVVSEDDWKDSVDAFEVFVDGANGIEGWVIAFRANSNKEIVLESNAAADIKKDLVKVVDFTSFTLDGDLTDANKELDVKNDFAFDTLDNTAAINEDYKEVGTYDFKTATTKVVDLKEEKVYTKWDSMIKWDSVNKKDVLVGNAVVIVEEGEDDIKYIIFKNTDEATTDSVYAMLQEVNSSFLKLFDGEVRELDYTMKESEVNTEAPEKSFVEYSTNSKGEVDAIAMLIDMVAFGKLGNKTVTSAVLDSGKETTLAVTLAGETTTNADHGTVACPKANDLTAVTCTCTGFEKYVAPEAAEYALTGDSTFADGKTYYTRSASEPYVYTEATVTTGDAVTSNTYYEETKAAVAKKDAVHKTIDCPETDCTGTCTDYKAATTTAGTTRKSFKVDKIEDYELTYADADSKLDEVKLDIDETVVYDVRNGKFEVVSLDSVKSGMMVIPFRTADADENAEANILVIAD